MRKLINYLCVLLFLLITHNIIQAQDFTVSVPSTDACANYLPPIKAGGSHQFQIRVENNSSDTSTVSIDKDALGIDVSSWITIDNNKQELFPSQSKNFLLTINVPVGTCDCDFTMFLDFEAKDKDGDVHEFSYENQYIIVDNSPPSSPIFSVSQTSSTIFVTSWYSWDDRSSVYTTWNSEAGIGGIKTYKVDIINPEGTIKKSVTKKFSDRENHNFTGLNPNTNYKARVTAYDLVGNTKTAEKSATTAPAKPTGLSFSNITYVGATLSWNPSAGATGYNVYKVEGSTDTKINGSPIAGASYNISGLQPNTTHKYNVIALSDVGDSDRSDDKSVTTIIPYIFGSTVICSQETYQIMNFLQGATVQWEYSGNVTISSGQGTSIATYSKNGNGSATISAVVSYEGVNIPIQKSISVGTPLRPYIYSGTTTKTSSTVNYNLTYGSSTTSLQLMFVEQAGSPRVDNWIPQITSGSDNFELVDNGNSIFINPTGIGTGSLIVNSENQCGTSSDRTKILFTIKDSNSGGGIGGGIDLPHLPIDFMVSPNPASDYLTVTIEEDKTNNTNMKRRSVGDKYIVQIWDTTRKIREVQSSNSSVDLPINDLRSGTYYIRIICNGTMNSRIFIKQ